MKAEVCLRGKYKTVTYRTQWEGDSYNNGAILCCKINGENKRYKISTYEAQDEQAVGQIIQNLLYK